MKAEDGCQQHFFLKVELMFSKILNELSLLLSLFATPCRTRDLSSWTKDGNCASCSGSVEF